MGISLVHNEYPPSQELRLAFTYGPSADTNALHLTHPPKTFFYSASISIASIASPTPPKAKLRCVCAAGEALAINADGSILFYAQGAAIYSLSLNEERLTEGTLEAEACNDNSEPVGQELLVSRHGSIRGLTLHPEEHTLAFVNLRTDHDIVGLLDVGEAASASTANVAPTSVRWVSPSVDLDVLPAWSPDGEALAFLRMYDDTSATFQPRRPLRGLPFSTMVAHIEDASVSSATDMPETHVVFRDLDYGYATDSGDAGA